MQVLKDEDKGLVKALPQKQFLERLKRPPPSYLGVHLLQAGLFVFTAKQEEQIGQHVFKSTV
jgi:hypothetical protein